MLERFPGRLSALRKEKHTSQRTAAQALGVSQALLSHYENGVREPGLEFVVNACSYYGVSADYLLGRSDLRYGAVAQPPECLARFRTAAERTMALLDEACSSACEARNAYRGFEAYIEKP